MGGFADLNSFSEEPIEFTDNRPANVIFSSPVTQDQALTTTDFEITVTRPYDIEEIIQPDVTQVSYSIDVSGVAGTTVAWDTVPSGSALTVVNGVYTINGIDDIATWDIVKDPTINIPTDFLGSFFYQVSVNYTTAAGLQTYSWEVGVQVPVSIMQSTAALNSTPTLIQSLGVINLRSESFINGESSDAILAATTSISAEGEVVIIDPNAQYLELAIPFNSTYGFDDVSHLYINNPKTQPIVNNVSSPSGVTIDSTFSKFYGSSYYATSGSGAKANYTLSQDLVTTDDWTMEFWCRPTKTADTQGGEVNSWLLSNNDYLGYRFLIGIHADTYMSYPTTFNDLTVSSIKGLDSANGYTPGDWVHIAIQPNSWWFRGAWMNPHTLSQRTFNILHLGQQNDSDPNDFLGNIQDFKLYMGVKKYAYGANISSDEINTPISNFIG